MDTILSKKYIFQAEENQHNPPLTDPVFIFNEIQYLSLWPEKIISCYLRNRHSGSITGFCHFQCENKTAWSLYQAPFASVYLKEDIGFGIIGSFVSSMIDFLGERGISKICLKHYPDFYSVSPPDKLITALLFAGFQIKQTDINHALIISEQPFEVSVHAMQRRRILKCASRGYLFQHHENNELEFLFKKIQELRMQKNIPVKITLERLKVLVDRFPDQYHLFSVQDNGRIIAITLMVSVNSTTLYNFLPASDEKYSTSSPMVYLIKNLYEYALSHHYRYIDLGVSSIKNQPQSGLINFKENLGGVPGIKFLLEKTIESKNV
ncbi:MAG: GNAT family N-acetyltransferase [Cyclobacteriaceae bacterium]|nr:GNAT family N-acetyltransferase [Cyclobacteriaceae bacterium]